jgi:hypothetical protein
MDTVGAGWAKIRKSLERMPPDSALLQAGVIMLRSNSDMRPFESYVVGPDVLLVLLSTILQPRTDDTDVVCNLVRVLTCASLSQKSRKFILQEGALAVLKQVLVRRLTVVPLVAAILNCFYFLSREDDNVKMRMFREDIVPTVCLAVSQNAHRADVQEIGWQLLESLGNDEERQRLLIRDHKICPLLVTMLSNPSISDSTLEVLWGLGRTFCVTTEACQAMVDAGMLPLLEGALDPFAYRPPVLCNMLATLRGLVRYLQNTDDLDAVAFVRRIQVALQTHMDAEDLVHDCCLTLHALTTSFPEVTESREEIESLLPTLRTVAYRNLADADLVFCIIDVVTLFAGHESNRFTIRNAGFVGLMHVIMSVHHEDAHMLAQATGLLNALSSNSDNDLTFLALSQLSTFAADVQAELLESYESRDRVLDENAALKNRLAEVEAEAKRQIEELERDKTDLFAATAELLKRVETLTVEKDVQARSPPHAGMVSASGLDSVHGAQTVGGTGSGNKRKPQLRPAASTNMLLVKRSPATGNM